MQVRELMSEPAITVGPTTPTWCAAEVLAVRGFTTLPVVDAADRLIGAIGDAELARAWCRPDRPTRRPHPGMSGHSPTALVGGVMSASVTTVEESADAADAARLLLGRAQRALPVLDEHGRVAGVLARGDLLRVLVRPDDEVSRDVLEVVERYTGDPGAVSVVVADGCARLTWHDVPGRHPAGVEAWALQALARSVPGVVEVHVDAAGPAPVTTTGPR